MKLARKMLFTAALAVVPLTAIAEPSYTHIDLGTASYTPKSGSTQNGPAVAGSFAFNDYVHAAAAYTDFSAGGVHNKVATLLLGYRLPVLERSDFVLRAGWMEQRSRSGDNRRNSDGYAVVMGFRNMLTDSLELNAWGTAHRTSRSRVIIGLEGIYHVNEEFGLVAGIDSSNNSDRIIRAGVRIAF